MKTPAPWRGAGGGAGDLDKSHVSNSTPFRKPQESCRPCEPLRRLQWLRQELDNWDAAEGARAMPQPEDFGLNLPGLRPSEINWGVAS